MTTRQETESKLREYVRKGEVRRARMAGFDYAYLEAEHTRQQKTGKAFQALCRKGMFLAIASAHAYVTEQLPEILAVELEDLEGTNIKVPQPSEQDMRDMVMYQYGSHHWLDYMAPQEFKGLVRDQFNDLRIRCNKAYGWNDKHE